MAGVSLDTLTFDEVLSTFTTMMIDDVCHGESARAQARERIIELIDERAHIYMLLAFQERRRSEATRLQWSENQAATIGNQNAQAIVGGPAGPPRT